MVGPNLPFGGLACGLVLGPLLSFWAFHLSPLSLYYSSLDQSFPFFPKNLKLTPNLGIKYSYSNKNHKICKKV